VGVDLAARTARTTRRTLRFDRLVSSVPFDRLVKLCALPHEPGVFTSNKVLVFNFGFDRKGQRDVHWLYFPARETSFYRVGFYDNIFDTDRLSIYVELGFPTDAVIDLEATRARVLADLARERVIDDHRLVAEHTVTMDPAYVHITQRSIAEHARLSALLRAHEVHSIGRYGGWTYCSIEDNIVEARATAARIGA
jgi:protoporphyrinogen oxidase